MPGLRSALLALLLGSTAWAGSVNLCTDANGKRQFSDLPCAQGSRADRVRTVESVIGGSGSDLQGQLELQGQRAARFIEGDETVRVSGTRTSASTRIDKDLCATARREYVEAKGNLLCWATATCESDKTRELYKRAARACRYGGGGED
ncbi:DUF4124 domain-containing protein [Chitinimonas sp.]|uniref:DUF4124 domain-containing protein n=1 Tax=Chitinimonas sp. TaxID=1934313 RepID=UPI002F948560